MANLLRSRWTVTAIVVATVVIGVGVVAANQLRHSSRPDALQVQTAVADSAEATSAMSVTTPLASLESRLAPEVNSVVPRSSSLAVAVFDSASGETWASNEKLYESASAIKLAILEAVVRKAESEDRSLTAGEKSAAQKMISISDNDAANTLWNRIGGKAGLAKFYRDIGATKSASNLNVAWGLSKTTAEDQVKVLRTYAYANNVLSDNGRAIVRSYLEKVDESQRWGVTAGSEGTTLLKNGWLPRPSGWVVNSLGNIDKDTHDYAIAVLSVGSKSEPAGIKSVEMVSAKVAEVMSDD